MQFKRILSLVAMTLLFAWGISTTLNAQGSDGFFRAGNDDSYSNRDGEMSLGDAVNENPTPLGSGLLIMMAAGAGYAVARRKRKSNSKKTKTSTTLFLALALILGMTQCKKSTVAPTTDNGIHITLNAGQGAKGDKTDFTPTSFVWTKGVTEYIYVGGSKHGACLGVLSGTGNGEATMSFSGSLTTTPNDGETLHFFYLGKGRDGSAITELDFSNQDGTLDNVTKYHIAIGDATYSTGQTSFSASLEMKMAIAYFNTSNFGSEEVFLHGNNIISKVSISYNSGELNTTSLTAVYGYINTGSGKNGAYVALIPSTEAETTLKLESNSKQGGEITFSRGIQAGRYYSNSGAALAISEPTAVTDVINGLFSISNTKMVRFAKGNLQYTRESLEDVEWETGAYSFLTNQYDVVETGNVSANYASQTAVGLFGWGTGDNPTTTSITVGDYSTFTDWGSFVTIGKNWYTLEYIHWNYLLNTRKATIINGKEARYLKAKISISELGDVYGLLLFPDSFMYPDGVDLPASDYINPGNYNRYVNFSEANWTKMELNGAVFLPMTGVRNGITFTNPSSWDCYYNTASSYNDSQSYSLYCYKYLLSYDYKLERFKGCAVRLVKDVE